MDHNGICHMVFSSSDRPYGPTVTISQHNFKVVDNFVYLGSQVNSKNDIVDEIRRRITLGNRCYFGLLNLLRSKAIHRNLKCMLYKILIRPVVTYGSESWCMTNKEEQILFFNILKEDPTYNIRTSSGSE